MKVQAQYLTLSAFLVAVNVVKVYSVCERKEVQGELSISDHLPLPVRYNVCVDSTVISPEPSLTRTGIATFARECCGCRVSSVSERELRIHTMDTNTQTRSIWVPEIQSCECIPCNANVYTWADYFLLLNHK